MKIKGFLSGKKIFISLLVLFGLLKVTSAGEEIDSTLVNKLESFKSKNPAEVIYLHTDQEVYSPGEDIYIKAYAKDYYSSSPGVNSKNLQLLLIDPLGNVFIKKVLPVEDSRAARKLRLTGNITEGKYTLMCYTGLMQNISPENIFSKQIFIKDISLPPIFVKLFVQDKIYSPSDKVSVTVSLFKFKGKPFKRERFSYLVRINNNIIINDEEKTDRDGKAVIEFNLPDFEKGSLVSFNAIAEQSEITESNTIIIPTAGHAPDIEFFAEGGSLVKGLETKVGFTALDYSGEPLKTKGRIVDENNKVVSDFKTLIDGLGYFTLKPEADKKYKAEITEPSGIEQTYDLPPVLQEGINIAFTGQANDLLSFEINSNMQDPARNIIAIAEVDGKITWQKEGTLNDFDPFEVPAKDLPRGIMRITLFDENMEVLSERAVYLNKKSTDIEVKTDRNEYIPGEEVNLNISSRNYKGEPVMADMSVSVVDDNISPDWNNDPDIFQWFLMGSASRNSLLPWDIFNSRSEESYRIIDCRMLTLDVEKFNWKNVLNGEKETRKMITGNEFVSKAIDSHRPQESELMADIEIDRFFYEYILTSNQVFPEYLYVNRRIMMQKGIKKEPPSRQKIIQKKLETGVPFLDVIRSIKPFQLRGDKIVFGGPTSLKFQQGALFVLDGVKLGTSTSVLSSLNPNDIANIEVLTSPTEVHRYTALNLDGVIVLTSKVEDSKDDDDIEQVTTYNSTLYWNPYIKTLDKGEISVSFPSSKMETKYRVVVQGVDESGQPVYDEIYFQAF